MVGFVIYFVLSTFVIHTSDCRYNDPTEAANMRMNLSNSSRDHLKPPHFQSLLSQSMSDLRMSPNLKGHNSSTPIRKLSSVLVTSSDNNNGSDLEQVLTWFHDFLKAMFGRCTSLPFPVIAYSKFVTLLYALKLDRFKKQHSSSSLLLTESNNTGLK